MSDELDLLTSRKPQNQHKEDWSRLPSSEKKRKRVSQPREASPTKKQRQNDDLPHKGNAKAAEIVEREDTAQHPLTNGTKHKYKKHRHDDRPQSRSPSSKSPFRIRRSSLYLPISPISADHAIQGLCAEHLSPLLLSYYRPLNGILLSYSNVQTTSELPQSSSTPPPHDTQSLAPQSPEQQYAHIVDTYGPFYTYLSADFLLFAPQRGDWLEGHVVLQNEGNISLVCYNFFSASIERKRLPKKWKWISSSGRTHAKARKRRKHDHDGDRDEQGETYDMEMEEAHDKAGQVGITEEGHFLISKHPPTVLSGAVRFQVSKIEKARSENQDQGLLSIEGTILPEDEEERLMKEEIDRVLEDDEARGERQRKDGFMSGALQPDSD